MRDTGFVAGGRWNEAAGPFGRGSAAPCGDHRHSLESAHLDLHIHRTRDGQYQAVLVGDVELVKGGQHRISKWRRGEGSDKTDRHGPGLTEVLLELLLEPGLFKEDRKLRVVGALTVRNRAGANEVIERGSQVMQGIADEESQPSIREAQPLVEMIAELACVRVRGLDSLVGPLGEVATRLLRERGDVVIGVRDLGDRARKVGADGRDGDVHAAGPSARPATWRIPLRIKPFASRRH